MAAGLQVWDETGALVMDTTTWVSHVLGTFTLTGPHAAGSLVNAGLLRGRPFAFVLPESGNEGSQSTGNPQLPVMTVSGSTLSWTAGTATARVVYGIY